jgi:hypothetical protein
LPVLVSLHEYHQTSSQATTWKRVLFEKLIVEDSGLQGCDIPSETLGYTNLATVSHVRTGNHCKRIFPQLVIQIKSVPSTSRSRYGKHTAAFFISPGFKYPPETCFRNCSVVACLCQSWEMTVSFHVHCNLLLTGHLTIRRASDTVFHLSLACYRPRLS